MVDKFERFSFAIFEIVRHWHKLAADEMEEHGLKGPHSIYLLTLEHRPEGVTAPQICELCGKDKADVSRTMALMEQKGLVVKEGIHQNLYRGVFKLTQSGKELAEHVRKRASLAVDLAGKELSEETLDLFYQSLDLIVANLRELSKDGLPDCDTH